MKLKFQLIMIAVAVFMAACSSDDDPTPAQNIAGVYNGTLALAVAGSDSGTIDDSKVTIKSQEDGNVEITLAKFGTETGMSFEEDIVISDVKVTTEDGSSYAIAGTINTTSGEVPITGSLAGTIKDGKADIVFTMKPGSMPMPIAGTFTSK